MTEFGLMGVDWEERIDFARMRRERLEKAQKALEDSGLDALMIFSPEDVRYTTGFRFHLGPVPLLLLVMVILPKGGEAILSTMDEHHVRARNPWLKPENIIGGPFRPSWGKEVKDRLGRLAEGLFVGQLGQKRLSADLGLAVRRESGLGHVARDDGVAHEVNIWDLAGGQGLRDNGAPTRLVGQSRLLRDLTCLLRRHHVCD